MLGARPDSKPQAVAAGMELLHGYAIDPNGLSQPGFARTSTAGVERTKKSTMPTSAILRQSQKVPPCHTSCAFFVELDLFRSAALRVRGEGQPREKFMSGQVVLYFDDQADALRFALAAGSVMAGDGSHTTDDLARKAARVTRIRLNATNTGKAKQSSAPERVA
jgi:hypothetical protein